MAATPDDKVIEFREESVPRPHPLSLRRPAWSCPGVSGFSWGDRLIACPPRWHWRHWGWRSLRRAILGTVGAEQHPWPPPTRCRSTPVIATTDVPRHVPVSPGGGVTLGENHCYRRVKICPCHHTLTTPGTSWTPHFCCPVLLLRGPWRRRVVSPHLQLGKQAQRWGGDRCPECTASWWWG